MISDNGGKSWYIGGNVTDWNLQYPNENQAVSLGGSNVFVNARTMLTDRIGALSKDGGLTFGPHFVLKGLPQPLGGCQGSTIRHPVTGILFYSGPATVSPFRHNMSIYTSLDNGLTWNAKQLFILVPLPIAHWQCWAMVTLLVFCMNGPIKQSLYLTQTTLVLLLYMMKLIPKLCYSCVDCVVCAFCLYFKPNNSYAFVFV